MKKNYIMPSTNVLMIQPASMIATSMKVNSEEGDTVIQSAGSILSRENSSSWDDED